MTENEAIARMKYRIETATDIAGNGVDGKAYEDMEIAIKALEEVQQYRAIGTVEECQQAVKVKDKITEIVNQQLIVGKDSYKAGYDCFYKIVKVIQNRDRL